MRQESRRRFRLASVLIAAVTLGLGLTGETANASQARGTITVEVLGAGMPVARATVSAGGRSAATNASGIATLTVPPGPVVVTAAKDGYETATARVDVVLGQDLSVRLVLTAKPTTVGRANVEETMLMAPGNIVTLLNGIRGLRVQSTSPELGTAMVRIQGLRGQYTRLLSDGVPLYFDHPGGLALVQIPPMDLAEVDVTTGGASARFGENALAGVVNLLSRRPGTERSREFLLSQSTEDATDGVLWIASPAAGPSSPSSSSSSRTWSRTFLTSLHKQNERDVDADGWSDIPGYSRGVVRQRVFWDNGRGRSASGTAGVTFETREGGSAIAHQSLESRGADGALFGQMPLGRYVLSGAGTLFVQSRTRDFSDGREHERREAATIELDLRGTAPRHTWVAGIAADWYALRSADPLPSKYSSTRPGIFVHDDARVSPWLTVSGSARLDHDITYGFSLSPRGSALVHGGPWAARVSASQSYASPLPFTEETEAAGLARLKIDGQLRELELQAARSVSADVSHTTRASVVALTVFHSHIDHPALVDRATYTLRNHADPVVTRGAEIAATARRAAFAVTGTYAYVRAREDAGREVALTPRHSARLIATAEADGRGRVGVEVNFTGVQQLDANPYRSTSEPYAVVSVLAERRFGRVRVFGHAENLTDVRQTRWDPIARPARDVDGRWTVDAWAPLRGRVINVGIRASF